MIDRQHGHIVVECGICCEVFESGSKDLIEACAEANRAGWGVNSRALRWGIACPKCLEPR